MKGYKNSTKTVYETESSANYAKGGKAMAKVGKVMGEFKRGTLHSGSKKGPEVKSPKQAIAIALNEARDAGAKIPVKKATNKQAGGLLAEREMAARDMVGKAKGGAVSAVHKHERNMHPGKPLTKMRNGGKVGC